MISYLSTQSALDSCAWMIKSPLTISVYKSSIFTLACKVSYDLASSAWMLLMGLFCCSGVKFWCTEQPVSVKSNSYLDFYTFSVWQDHSISAAFMFHPLAWRRNTAILLTPFLTSSFIAFWTWLWFCFHNKTWNEFGMVWFIRSGWSWPKCLAFDTQYFILIAKNDQTLICLSPFGVSGCCVVVYSCALIPTASSSRSDFIFCWCDFYDFSIVVITYNSLVSSAQ